MISFTSPPILNSVLFCILVQTYNVHYVCNLLHSATDSGNAKDGDIN